MCALEHDRITRPGTLMLMVDRARSRLTLNCRLPEVLAQALKRTSHQRFTSDS